MLLLDEFMIVSEEDTDNSHIYHVTPYGNVSICPICGCRYIKENGIRSRYIKDIPINGKYGRIELTEHLYRCTKCGKDLKIPYKSVLKRSRLTSRLRKAIYDKYAVLGNAYKVADIYGVSEGLVRKIVKNNGK